MKNSNGSKIEVNSKGILLTVIISLILLTALNYFLLMPLNFDFPGVLVALAIIMVIVGVVIGLSGEKPIETAISVGTTGAIMVMLLLVIGFFTTTEIIHSKAYRDLLGEVKEQKFSDKVSPIDLNQLPIVDAEYAKNLADKKLGEIPGLGSQVTLGDVTIQQVNNRLMYVVPLNHSGFFKWNSNKEGTTGYITVSATNPDDVNLVTEINGKPLKIKYQPGAFFGTNLYRHAYYNSMFRGLTDFSFEIDDQGVPYWVITEYDRTIGFSGEKVTGILIMDASTGEIKRYDTNNIPAWVDRIYPVGFIANNLNYWGKYVHGFWNFSNKDKLQTTEGIKAVYYNGNCYYYTGMTSVGSDESTVGFMLTDTKTGEATFFKVSGSTEVAGMGSAVGKVQHLEYSATFPILINVQGQPTYFTTLKDKKGLVKMYAMVNVQNYSIASTGETVKEAMDNYINDLANRGSNASLETSGEVKEEQGTVERIGMLITEKTSIFYVVTKEKPNTLIILPQNISKEIPVTKEGDKVSYKYVEMKSTDITAKEFNNLNIDLK